MFFFYGGREGAKPPRRVTTPSQGDKGEPEREISLMRNFGAKDALGRPLRCATSNAQIGNLFSLRGFGV